MTAARRRPIALGIAAAALGLSAWMLMRGRVGAIGADAESATGPARVEPPAALAAPDLAAAGGAAHRAAARGGATDPSGSPSPRDDVTSVEFVDAITGAPILGCELIGPLDAGGGGCSIPVAGRALQDTAEVVESTRVRALANPYPDNPFWSTRDARLPSGIVAWATIPEPQLANRARSYRVVQPLHREVDLRITMVDPAGSSSDDVQAVHWSIGDRVETNPRVEREAGGVLRVRGVPWIPGQRWSVTLERPSDREGTIIEDGQPFRVRSSWMDWACDLPATSTEPIDARISLRWVREIRSDVFQELPWGRTFGDAWPPSEMRIARPGRAAFTLTVLDAAGRPLPGLALRSGDESRRTDGGGTVNFGPTTAEPLVLSIVGSGYLFDPKSARLKRRTGQEFLLRESAGATVDVSVVGPGDAALPFASVSITSRGLLRWSGIDEDGVQRLDPFTDAQGRRTCRRVPTGRAEVRASWGGRRASLELDLAEGDVVPARLVVR